MQNLKKVLITGSSRGIGAAATERFLNEYWNVIGTFNNNNPHINSAKSNLFEGIKVDLSDVEQVAFLKKYFEAQSIPDVIINNAGMFTPSSFTETDEDFINIWDKTLQVNLTSVSLICKWYIESCLQNQKVGIIINVSSRAAYRGETADYPAYAASKAGLVALTKTIARGYGRNNVFAYSIAPGFVQTDMATESIETYGKDYLTKDLVLNEIVPPSEVADLIFVLAQGKLKHMTGQTFHINSGSYLL